MESDQNRNTYMGNRCYDSNIQNYSPQFKYKDLPESILQMIEDYGYDLVAICDRKGKVLNVSSAIHRILGYRSEEIIGTSSLAYIAPKDKKIVLKKLKDNDRRIHKFIISLRNTRGKYIWVETIVSIMKSTEQGGKDQIVSITKDITDKKEAEEMMIRSEKMSVAGQLAAGVAHEIRNPLTSLKGFLQLLQAGIDSKEEYYTIMKEEIEKIETITSELLFVSKPMTEVKKVELLSTLLNDVVTLLQAQAKLFTIEIQVNIHKEIFVYCDRLQIKQVFINLIKNAVEEMQESGGKIQIIADATASICTIDIVDEGPGIPNNIIDKLKEPFFTTKKHGTGLGLMITSQILEKHDGNLEILQNQGKGSTFRVILPLHENPL
ncbi:ATP-binding protein [Aquibacillus sp. 3ASR75-11]|uniref:histidine kinase n=1 Tax=Terrihalobacillus insolitus TaxID=2950438 RepID=A0A9X3WWP2_9BACI|nr:ATP-binding protein [Terrihalobacillus insolitus]MDC3415018.1 ATP-binding protein [Terrihalobacillus insolitus]MDC3425928.1 ATP-binding protein [Terrihalobacillus insolitus]